MFQHLGTLQCKTINVSTNLSVNTILVCFPQFARLVLIRISSTLYSKIRNNDQIIRDYENIYLALLCPPVTLFIYYYSTRLVRNRKGHTPSIIDTFTRFLALSIVEPSMKTIFRAVCTRANSEEVFPAAKTEPFSRTQKKKQKKKYQNCKIESLYSIY